MSSAKTQAEVKEKLKKAIEENVGIDYGRAKTYTVGVGWRSGWKTTRKSLRPSTFKTSQGFLKNHIKPKIGGIPLADLTSLDLQRFYKHLLDGGRVDRIEAKKKPKGLAPKTVRNIHQMIGSAYNLAMEQKLVSKNPNAGLRPAESRTQGDENARTLNSSPSRRLGKRIRSRIFNLPNGLMKVNW